MCELLAMSARERTILARCVLKRGGLTAPHKDGWGIAIYDDGDAWLVRDTLAASVSLWARVLNGHAIPRRLVISHVR
jgi:glutamine amidotransferase